MRRGGLTRRDVLIGGAAAALPLSTGRAQQFRAGSLFHLLPAASHDRFLIKASFARPLTAAPVLVVGRHRVRGLRTDSAGAHWLFDARGLTPATTYRLGIEDASGASLSGAWPLRTFPAPDQSAERLRILSFTCAGGYPFPTPEGQREGFRPLAIRHRLLDRALSFAPDVAVANGDHIYSDQRTWSESENPAIRQAAQAIAERFGRLDPALPALGSANEAIIKRLAGPQIAGVYETRFRSTPMFFVSDDHDYFENDEATDRYVTFPPEAANLGWARATQHLFYPEFLPDPARAVSLPGSNAADRPDGLSEAFGTLRYGTLLEALIYDCGRFVSLKDRHAGLVPPEVEAWLLARTAASDTTHSIHMPSHPFGWSAGKWREWYPDVAVGDGGELARYGAAVRPSRLSTAPPKYLWQQGWWLQHQRLLAAMVGNRSRAAVMLSGDLHAVGAGRMSGSGNLRFADNPLHVLLAGPIGTSALGWPSASRGLPPMTASDVTMTGAPPAEKNGVTIVDVERHRMTVRQFAWREPDPVEAIDTLQPFSTFEIRRT